MTKLISLVFALALVSVITLAGASTASAKGKNKQAISFQTQLFVTAPPVVGTNPHSGWSTIELEDLAGTGFIDGASGPVDLNGLYLTAQQSSHEQCTSSFLPAANVKKGKSKGTFCVTDPGTGEIQVVGKYQLKVSTNLEDGCQIYGEGKWKSKAKNSIIEGKGKITVCTNWVWINAEAGIGTFFSNVSVTGSAVAVD